MAANTRDIDHGWNEIVTQLRFLDSSYTKVGLPEESSPASVDDGDHETMSDLIMVGAANEFGTTRIPERSFLRSATDENIHQINTLTQRMYSDVITLKRSVINALGVIGEFLTKKVQQKIIELRSPPNAPSTLRAKFPKTNPLINKGQLLQSITHVEALN